MSRKLPASERINHTLLAINYGAILVLLLPVLIDSAMQPTGVKTAYAGLLSVAAVACAIGTALCAARDLAATRRLARMTMPPARDLVDKVIREGRVVYGVNTGFGKLSDVHIKPDGLDALQLNLVRSHSCGLGRPLSESAAPIWEVLRGPTPPPLPRPAQGRNPGLAHRRRGQRIR